MGNTQSQEKSQEKHEFRKRDRETRTTPLPSQSQPQPPPAAAVPVDVPIAAPKRRNKDVMSHDINELDYTASSNLNFPHPPRLPLPIQDQLYTPGSPVISPEDLANVVHEDGGAALPHQTSLLSHTTMDEDEEVDLLDQANKGLTVPARLEWKGPGNKIYVTGTFNGWSKKYRMQKSDDTGILSATLDLPPGTYHIKFIVDGDMQTSKDLPTTVDLANVLVNYIEVSADDIPYSTTESQPPEGVHPPMVLPAGIATTDFEHPDRKPSEKDEEESKLIFTKGIRYGNRVPQYLLDLDRPEQSHRFQRAENQLQEIPTPPSLPLFLSKSILNGTMPMRDDISVLNFPNHTVLNHVATSSIKNEVLATSMTTRYKAKYVTTVIYRAINDEE
ncbi:MAG: hypothetical protein GOMPHAMPRED_001839 [Gomphillus americanus]|uniref:Association with the SNF1 complex (ASC) domain-containing protein n=1 Tax=Gomphillus americanus TaxID=1940652 RepID=A0A8H3F9J8_9LECA|nr:MAG: hypothetical protein GOMPHAMPRED_001839 [Gomphillus americanus]